MVHVDFDPLDSHVGGLGLNLDAEDGPLRVAFVQLRA